MSRNNHLEINKVERPENVFPGLRVAVTGGTSGLGLALVRELLGRGAQVAFVARRREGIERVIREHNSAHGIVGDVSKKDDMHPIAMQIVGLLGGLDVLINNASDLGPAPLALLADTECEDLERALATNVLGPFRLTKALFGSLASSAREGRGAVVLNVSSDAAIHPYPRWGAYGASKAALHHLSRIWSEELTSAGIAILSLDPGDMDTPLHAMAVPDAEPSELKRPETAAREFQIMVKTVGAICNLDCHYCYYLEKENLYPKDSTFRLSDETLERYIAQHIHQVWRAVNFNWPVKGYFYWSLVDNFEWERGWTQRFGLWGLDVETQKRIKRPSADLYAEICKENGLTSEMVQKYCPEVFDKLFPV